MAKFCKKPIVIEAWQWNFTPDQEAPPAWANDALNLGPHVVGGMAFWPDGNGGNGDAAWADKPHLAIHTLEGVMIAEPGDWIIQGIKAEIYPCKPDIFTASYSPVAE